MFALFDDRSGTFGGGFCGRMIIRSSSSLDRLRSFSLLAGGEPSNSCEYVRRSMVMDELDGGREESSSREPVRRLAKSEMKTQRINGYELC